MCRERKNKSFIPTWAIGWRQNFPRKARKFPLPSREEVGQGEGAGTRGRGMSSLGVVKEAKKGTESSLESGEAILPPSPALEPERLCGVAPGGEPSRDRTTLWAGGVLSGAAWA